MLEVGQVMSLWLFALRGLVRTTSDLKMDNPDTDWGQPYYPVIVRWSHIVGQFGSEVKVYSSIKWWNTP